MRARPARPGPGQESVWDYPRPPREQVRPQDGGFYGRWGTDDVVGPFKGAPGTLGW